MRSRFTSWNGSVVVGLALIPLDGCATDQTTAAQPAITARRDDIHAEHSGTTQLLARWNEIALRTTLAAPFDPPRETRSIAMVSAAVYDAVASITGRYEPFFVHARAHRNASIDVAASAAARQVLVALYPAAATAVNAAYDSIVAAAPNGKEKANGVAAGLEAASAILAARANDHASDPVSYTPGHGVGVWVPTPPAFASALDAGWGRVTPFVLRAGSQLRPGVPPAVGSPAYVRDLNEVREMGSAASSTRTPAQTEAARFWAATGPQLWNQVVRQLAVAPGLDPTSAARMYFLVNAAAADAIIATWEAKYVYNQWRPVTAIQGGDGGLTTVKDPTWAPLLPTPPFPDYPSGHSAYAGAVETVLSALGGERGDFAISSPTAGGATQHYRTVHEIADEVTDARVWAGAHWRTSCDVARILGQQVAKVVLARASGTTPSS